jgi:hypothetical protein
MNVSMQEPFTHMYTNIAGGSRASAFLTAEGKLNYTSPVAHHASGCPLGTQGSSLPLWCCAGLHCDCVASPPKWRPPGRGGGIVKISVLTTLGVDGAVSSNGESVGCTSGLDVPRRGVYTPPGQDSSTPPNQIENQTHSQTENASNGTGGEVPVSRESEDDDAMWFYSTGGAGAGGSVLIHAQQVYGRGTVGARGGRVDARCRGTRSGGGGAGGRIALWYEEDLGNLTVSATGGSSDGCASAAAGTLYYAYNKTLVVNNEDESTASATTPFPDLPAGMANLTTMFVLGGSMLEFPREKIMRVVVLGAALIATNTSTSLMAGMVSVSQGGILGCVACTSALDAQNRLPGCAEAGNADSVCPAFAVHADTLLVALGGRILGINIGITAHTYVDIAERSHMMTSDFTTSSVVTLLAPVRPTCVRRCSLCARACAYTYLAV